MKAIELNDHEKQMILRWFWHDSLYDTINEMLLDRFNKWKEDMKAERDLINSIILFIKDRKIQDKWILKKDLIEFLIKNTWTFI